jgi:hypothetical protein
MDCASHLRTVADVIDAFGGIRGIRAVFGGVPSRFANYKARNSFPGYLHMRVYAECLKRGLTIAPELIGMTPDEMAIARGERQRQLPLMPQSNPAR